MSETNRIIVALDYSSKADALAMAQQLDPALCRVKVGKELFTREGPAIVEALQTLGFDLFLDLKFHDIPNTVAKACGVAAELGVWMVNVHASGGQRMMEAAAEAVDRANRRADPTQLIAVTVLTSMERSDLEQIGLDLDPFEQVKRLARLTQRSGLSGVVCSAQEASALRAELGSDFALVTPGIRPKSAVSDDQRRVMTPATAILAGSTYLVIGRPITADPNPVAALEVMNQQVLDALR